MDTSVQWREWSLAGLKVTQLKFDYQIHVHMWTRERDLVVIFEAPVTLLAADGNACKCYYAKSETLCPLLSLLFQEVSAFHASSEGECRLEFEDGTELVCGPDEQCEAWQSHGSGNLVNASLLCGPGGGAPWGVG
jgi:hypothetical protein